MWLSKQVWQYKYWDEVGDRSLDREKKNDDRWEVWGDGIKGGGEDRY